ncbi:DoxX family protein [Acrocarpospora catenulata]|uniref:DoxX family protein n=1 Tax=Acrocarpospora catenulata TaxID=2836182 RepID=UPI001BD93436|nr:DoxX family protein [Acrocarpospora catenulata]
MKRTLHDLASLAARIGVGGIFFANGWEKLEAGLNATRDQFQQLQAPLPGFWAPTTMLIELVGGVLLIAGLAVPAIGVLLFAEALAVFILTAGDAALPLTGGNVSLIVALGAASILLAVNGGGRLSVDHMVIIKRREAEDADDYAAEAEADAVLNALREPASPDPKGPVTFPASSSPAAVTEELTKPKPRRPAKKAEETTGEHRAEPSPAEPAKPEPAKPAAAKPEPAKTETGRRAGGEAGDTLVAGRRSGKSG